MNYVRIDVHKHSFQAAILDEDGSLLGEVRLRNNREGLQMLIDRAGCYGEFNGRQDPR